MPKIEVSQAVELIKSHEIEPETLRQIIITLSEFAAMREAEYESRPAKFWLVLRVSKSGGPQQADSIPTVRHATREAAEVEAERLAVKHPTAYGFAVLEAVSLHQSIVQPKSKVTQL